MTADINILFLGGAKRVSVAEYFINAGQQLGRQVRIFSYELSDDLPIREVATIIIGKKWAECEQHLTDVIRDYNIHVVIPFVDPATVLTARLREAGVPFFSPVSDSATCNRFFSKIAANTWCLENDIPVPVAVDGQYPRIAKPDTGSASQGIIIMQKPGDESRLDPNQQYLIQRYLDAREYTVDAYRSTSHGNINYLVPRERLETLGGEAVKARTLHNEKIESLSREIIMKSGLSGAITLQFLEEKSTGEICFMEVNPRFGGGLVTSAGAGVDIAGTVLADMQGAYREENHDWEAGLLMIRRFKEIYIHANRH